MAMASEHQLMNEVPTPDTVTTRLSADLIKHILSFLADLSSIRLTCLAVAPLLDDICVRPYCKKLHRGLSLHAHVLLPCQDCDMAAEGRVRCCYCELQFGHDSNRCRKCGFLLCDHCVTIVEKILRYAKNASGEFASSADPIQYALCVGEVSALTVLVNVVAGLLAKTV